MEVNSNEMDSRGIKIMYRSSLRQKLMSLVSKRNPLNVVRLKRLLGGAILQNVFHSGTIQLTK